MLPAFDEINFQDLRVLAICGNQWARLGATSVSTAFAIPATNAATELADKLLVLERWVEKAEHAPLEDLVEDLLLVWERARRTSRRYPEDQFYATTKAQVPQPLTAAGRKAVVARLGLDGAAPRTVPEAAKASGLSTARVIQLTDQIVFAARHRVWAPPVDRALALADGSLSADEYARLLQDEGVARGHWHPEAVASLARLCGRSDSWLLHKIGKSSGEHRAILGIADRLIRKHLLTTVDDIAAELAGRGSVEITWEHVRAALLNSDKHVICNDWVGHETAGILPKVITRLLAVSARAGGKPTVETIRAGLARYLKRKHVSYTPSAPALASYLVAHPHFDVAHYPDPAHSVAWLKTPPPPLSQLFGRSALAIINAVLASPGLVITLPDLMKAARAAGVSEGMVSQVLTFNEAVVHHSDRLWTVVGVYVTPAAAERARTTLPPGGGSGGSESHPDGYTDGCPWWIVTLTPAFLNHRRFERRSLAPFAGDYLARDEHGKTYGALTVRQNGRLSGLRRYLDSHPTPDGSRLRITLDPQSRYAMIETLVR